MSELFNFFFDLFIGIWQNIMKFAQPLLTFISGAINKFVPLIVNALTWILDSITNIINFFKGIFG